MYILLVIYHMLQVELMLNVSLQLIRFQYQVYVMTILMCACTMLLFSFHSFKQCCCRQYYIPSVWSGFLYSVIVKNCHTKQ